MGGLPVAEHQSLYPGNALRTGTGNSTVGGTIEITTQINSLLINIRVLDTNFSL